MRDRLIKREIELRRTMDGRRTLDVDDNDNDNDNDNVSTQATFEWRPGGFSFSNASR